MGTRSNQDLQSADPEVINEYLGSSFKHMARYGEKVYKPFMQVGRRLVTCRATTMALLSRHVCALPGERERETLHPFQPPRADQMPDPCWGQCHSIRLGNL